MDRRSTYLMSSKKATIIGHSICYNGGSNVKIQKMFQKDIERDINGVIKVMQDDDRSLEQELANT